MNCVSGDIALGIIGAVTIIGFITLVYWCGIWTGRQERPTAKAARGGK